ncbi:MAG: PaaI family thioesterase [Burkholderiales bacterium]
MAKTLGVRLVSVSKKRVVAEMPVGPEHLNRSLRVNGGALMAFADVLGATGTVANLPPGHRTTTLESKTNFFAAGEGPVLNAVSKPLHIGRTTMVWQTTIRNADRRLVAIVTQTQMVLPGARVPNVSGQPPSVGRKR